MKTRLILSVLASVAAVPAFAAGPNILAPGETAGVLQRTLDIGLMKSARPLPRPAALLKDVPAPTPIVMEAALTVEAAPLTPMEAVRMSGEPFALTEAGLMKFSYDALTNPAPTQMLAFALPGGLADPDAPAYTVLAEAETAPAAPVDPMVEVIRRTLSGSYEMTESDGDGGFDRLLSLAEGRGEVQAAAIVSSEAYEFEAPVNAEASQIAAELTGTTPASASGTIMGMDPAAALLSSLPQGLLASLTPEQLSAMVMAAQGRPVDMTAMRAAAQPQMASVPGGALAMPGIPSLDYRGDDLPTPQVISAADVPAGSMPFDSNAFLPSSQPAAAAPAPVQVGDGQNLLLKGWTLGLTGSGEIGMYMVGDPGSIIEISEGMVIGPLGMVQSLTMENGNIIAKFSSGEEMVSPAALVSMASL